MRSQNAYPLAISPAARKMVPFAACFALALHSPVWAQDRHLLLQGLFCNTEDEIDDALGYMSQGMTPMAAAAIINKNDVVCTYVDVLHYVVEHPVEIWQNTSTIAAGKYKAMLTGVIVGSRLRPISPPVEIYFATPERLARADLEWPA